MLQVPEVLRNIAIPRVVADWAQCTWLYDNLTNVTISPMQRVIGTELRQLGACASLGFWRTVSPYPKPLCDSAAVDASLFFGHLGRNCFKFEPHIYAAYYICDV